MRVYFVAFWGAVLFAVPFATPIRVAAQQGTAAQSAPNPVSAPSQQPPAAGAQKPSAILQPAMDDLKKAISSLNLDKWKRGNVRTEAETNISSIMRDAQDVLPGLTSEADSAPMAMSKTLPVSRNVDALYDVLLRVVDAARISAPGDQVDALQQAQASLEKARRTLDAQLQDMAASQEKQVSNLQVALRERQAAPVPVAAPPPAPVPCTPVKKARPRKKPAPATGTTPSGSQPSGSQPSGTQKPAAAQKPQS